MLTTIGYSYAMLLVGYPRLDNGFEKNLRF